MENPQEAVSQPTAETEHLNKIRSILFGEQIRHQNQRLEALEAHMNQTCQALSAQFTNQIEALENQLIERFDDLSRRLEQQATQQSHARQTAIDTVEQTLTNTINQQILSAKSSFEHQIEQTSENMQALINQQRSTNDTERSQLSEMFGEISKRLAQQ